MSDAYAAAGVDTRKADAGVSAIVRALAAIETGRPSRSRAPGGHYAAVLEVAPNLGIAIGTDSAGSKVIVAEQTGRFDTIGIDCVAMNVNDVVCIGAEPIALVDYLAVEQSDPGVLRQIAEGLARGAADAGVEVPGGELAVLPEVVRGHPSPRLPGGPRGARGPARRDARRLQHGLRIRRRGAGRARGPRGRAPRGPPS